MYKMTTWRWAMDFVNEVNRRPASEGGIRPPAEKTGLPAQVS